MSPQLLPHFLPSPKEYTPRPRRLSHTLRSHFPFPRLLSFPHPIPYISEVFIPVQSSTPPSTSDFVCQLQERSCFHEVGLTLFRCFQFAKVGTPAPSVCQKKEHDSRRAVATLGAVLNDRTGAVRFAARRTTNREPP